VRRRDPNMLALNRSDFRCYRDYYLDSLLNVVIYVRRIYVRRFPISHFYLDSRKAIRLDSISFITDSLDNSNFVPTIVYLIESVYSYVE
jgi:hypothetical protein